MPQDEGQPQTTLLLPFLLYVKDQRYSAQGCNVLTIRSTQSRGSPAGSVPRALEQALAMVRTRDCTASLA